MWSIWAKIESWLHFPVNGLGEGNTLSSGPGMENLAPSLKWRFLNFREMVQRERPTRSRCSVRCAFAQTRFLSWAPPLHSKPCWLFSALLALLWPCFGPILLEDFTVQSFKVILQMCTRLLIYEQKARETCPAVRAFVRTDILTQVINYVPGPVRVPCGY